MDEARGGHWATSKSYYDEIYTLLPTVLAREVMHSPLTVRSSASTLTFEPSDL